MDSTIILKIDKKKKERIESYFTQNNIEFDLIEVENFDGMSETVQIILAISATTIPVIGKIIIELIKSNQHVSVKYKNFEMSGVDENKMLNFLDKILNAEETNKNDAS